MADKDLAQNNQLAPTDLVRYTEIAAGVYALTTASILASDSGNQADIDAIADGLVVIDTVHNKVHSGDLFSISYKTPNANPLADDATIVIALQSSSRYLHFQAFAAAGGDAEIEFYSGSTIGADGTLMTPSNHSLGSLDVSTVTVRRDPTVNAAGTLRDNFLLPGGTGGNAVGSDGGQRDEWLVPPLTWLFVRLTNRAGNAQQASIKAVWYE
jgi:hypothetical protein